MKQIAAIFLVIMLVSFSFGCNDDDGDNKAPTAWLSLEPPEAVIYDNSTESEYPEITLNGNQSNDPDGSITYYFYDMGNGNTTQGGSGDNSTTHIYDIAGYFKVSLEVEDNDGDKDKTTKELTINYKMHHVSNPPLGEGDTQEEPFPVSMYSPYNATVTVVLENREVFGTSDAKVSVRNPDDVEVESQEETAIDDQRTVTFQLGESHFDTHGYGLWDVFVECTSGTIYYDCSVDLFYKD